MVPGGKLLSQISRLAHSAKLFISASLCDRSEFRYVQIVTRIKPNKSAHWELSNEPKNVAQLQKEAKRAFISALFPQLAFWISWSMKSKMPVVERVLK